MKLKENISLITGGAAGIGKAIALTFADEGSDIVLIDINEEKAREVAEQIQEKNKNCWTYIVDVSDYKKVEKLINTEIKKWEKIDILVNNAGIIKDNLILRMKEEEWDEVIRTNLKGAFNFSKIVGKYMMKQGRGVIINITSIIGIVGNIGQVNYAASKGGLIGLTRSLAKEFAPRNIRVNGVAPGFIQTSMTENLKEDIKKRILDAIPLRRMGTPQEVAKSVLFLASEGSSYITGQIINIDGGMVM